MFVEQQAVELFLLKEKILVLDSIETVDIILFLRSTKNTALKIYKAKKFF